MNEGGMLVLKMGTLVGLAGSQLMPTVRNVQQLNLVIIVIYLVCYEAAKSSHAHCLLLFLVHRLSIVLLFYSMLKE